MGQLLSMEYETCGTVIIHKEEQSEPEVKNYKANMGRRFPSELQSFNVSPSETKSDYSNFVNFMKKMPENQITIHKILDDKKKVNQKIGEIISGIRFFLEFLAL